MYFFLGILLLLVDQGIKYLVRTKMAVYDSLPVIADFFHLTYVQNRGAAFGMFQEGTLIFAGVTILVVAMMIYYLKKYPAIPKTWKVALTMIAAGAVGNLIDRLTLGFVVDMFDFRGIWSYIFNFADVCVVLGGCGLILLVLKEKEPMEKNDE